MVMTEIVALFFKSLDRILLLEGQRDKFYPLRFRVPGSTHYGNGFVKNYP